MKKKLLQTEMIVIPTGEKSRGRLDLWLPLLCCVLFVCVVCCAIPGVWPEALAVGLALSAPLAAGFYLLGRRFGFVWPLFYGLLAAALWGGLQYQKVWSGLVYLANAGWQQAGNLHTPYTVVGALPEAATAWYGLLFFLLWIAPWTAYCIGQRRPFGLLALCCLLAAVLFGGGWTASLWPFLAAVLLALLFGVVAGPRAGAFRGAAKNRFLWGGGLLLLAVGLSIALSAAFWHSAAYPAATAYQEKLADGLQSRWEEARYGGDVPYTPLPEGDLRATSPVTYTENPVLSVAMQAPEPMYFKTFRGAAYADGLWQEAELSAEDQAMFLYLAQEGFYPNLQLASLLSLAYDTSYSSVQLTNYGLSSKSIYAPYQAAYTGLLDSAAVQPAGDDGILAREIIPDRTYSFLIASAAVDDLVMDDALAEIRQHITDQGAYENFTELEAIYRAYVYDHYLTVGETEDQSLRSLFSEETIQSLGNASHRKIITILQTYFTDHYTYSQGEPAPPAGSDPLQQFIQTKTGYDVHFATLATLLFREAGIPARYAEGYYLSQADVELYTSMQNITFEVPDSYAHAWVEIYLDEIGWTPVEITPGFFPLIQDSESMEGTEEVLVEDPSYFYLKEEEAAPDPEPEPPQPEETSILSWPLLFAIALVVLLLAFALLFPVCRRKWRFAAFAQADTKQAVLAIYRHGLRLLQRRGGQGSVYLESSQAAFIQAFPGLPPQELAAFVEQAFAVRFGYRQPEAAEVQRMLACLQQMRQALLEHGGKGSKIKGFFASL